jgi:hypothetical protein
MSTFNYNQAFEYDKESGIFNAPSLLSGGLGGSFNFGAMAERATYAATAGGSGRFAFGAADTPQRNVVDWKYGWDPNIADRPDPNFNREAATHLWEKVLTPEMTAAVLFRGGEELKKDLIENSVSQAHFLQRVSEIEIIARAELEIDRYDAESNFLTYGFNKTFSAIVNYIASDPTTAVSFIATGGMATAARAGSLASAAAAAGTNVSRGVSIGARISSLATNYGKTYKAATYLWDGMDGASSAYSSFKQMNDDGLRIYGKTYEADTNWTDDVAFGTMLGLGFSVGGDLLNRAGNKADNAVSGLSPVENMAANSAEGTLGTAIDQVALSAWRSSKSRLERNLDTITGPDTELRRVLMDDEARTNAHWGTREDMDDLSDWIETNRPDAAELNQYVSDRLTAAQRTQEQVAAWTGEVETYVLNGGDQAHFFRKKAMDLLRAHMGDDFAQYRFIVDYLEGASGDARLVAEWMARGDKDRVVRVANAINANKRISVLEDKAVNAALKQISDRGYAAATDEAVQAMNRVNDNITQGRFQGGVDILNEMHTEAATRTGNMIASVDGAINQLNDAFVRLNDEGFERLDHFKEMINALKKVRDAAQASARRGEATRARTMRALDPDADNATVLTAATEIIDDSPAMTTALSDAIDELNEATRLFRERDAALAETLDEVRKTRREILAKGGSDALNRTMEESGTFPLWKVSLSQSGFNAVRRGAVQQTQAANRWKVEFVDRFLGSKSADTHLTAGTNPLRPVYKARTPIQRMTVAEQEAALSAELAKVAPEIEAIRAGAKDLPLDQKITNLRGGLTQMTDNLPKLKEAAEKAKAGGAGRKVQEAYKDAIAKRERAIKRTQNLIDRLDKQLNGQVDVLNRDVVPTAIITADTVRAERAAVKIAANNAAAKKLNELKPEEFATKKGRNIRNKARKAAAEVGNNTEYSVLRRETELIDAELAAKQAERDALRAAKATDADPRLVDALDEITYLEKRRTKIAGEMNTIEGRPAMIRRSHELGSAAPKVENVMEISRLRAQIAVAVRRGENEFAEELNRRLYNLYGDATQLPRWTALEDFFIARQMDALDGKPVEDILSATMDGRNIRFSVASREAEDIAVQVGVDDVIGDLPTRPDMPSMKGVRVATESTKKAAKDMRDQQMLEAAMESDPATAEARSASKARTVSYVNSAVTDPTVSVPSAPTATSGASGSKPASPGGKGTKAPTKEEVKANEKVEKQKRILEKLSSKSNPGERLVITNEILMRMGQVPILRGLGRAIFSLQTAGTGFADIHNSARVLDMMVTAFNMLDRPEALVKSLGFNDGAVRTMQNFRDRGRLAVNELTSAEVRARNAGHYRGRPDEDQLLQDALDSGDTTGLNAGMLEMYQIMRRHYDEAGQRLAVSHGAGTVRPNYRPREPNSGAIMARMNEAQGNFRDAYAHRIMTSGEPIPDTVADAIGVPRGTAYNVLSVADQNAFRPAIEEYANEMAVHTISRLTSGVTEAGVGYRVATSRADSAAARTLEDAVYRDPRVRQYYIGSPVQEHKLYMEIRSPQILFDAQLTEMLGERANFDEVIDALRSHANTILDSQVKREYEQGVDLLEQKWHYNTGRAQYNNTKFFDPAFRVSTGVVRGSFGAFWGMAGIATEMNRAVTASRLYGGGMRGIFDLMHAIRHSNDLAAMEDIAHATDQYSSLAHSSFGSSVGTTMAQRFIAPWERVWHTMTGREVITNGGTPMGRGTSTVVAAAEAYGETGMRLGGMQWASGVARLVADRQAKRFVTRNIDNMERLATALERIGAVAENTPQARAAFKNAAAEAGLPYDVALQMNHSGLLTPNAIRNLRNGLAGQEECWSMGMMRGRVDDQTMSAVMDYLTAAHNFHVPTASLASSVESRSVWHKLVYNLTSYSRAFALNVAYRTATNGSYATMLSTIAAVMIGENIYQATRETITGKKTVEDLEQEWEDNPSAFFVSRAVKSPWLGAHNSSALSVIDQIAGGSAGANMRGNSALAPIMQSFGQVNKLIFSDEKTGERDLKFLNTHTPLFNTWYSQLITGGLE